MSRCWLEVVVGGLLLVAHDSAQDRICGGGDAAAPTAGLRRTVYYTGKFDTQMWNLTTPHWGAAWPAGWRFEFHDDAALEASILALDRRLAAAGDWEGAVGAYGALLEQAAKEGIAAGARCCTSVRA